MTQLKKSSKVAQQQSMEQLISKMFLWMRRQPSIVAVVMLGMLVFYYAVLRSSSDQGNNYYSSRLIHLDLKKQSTTWKMWDGKTMDPNSPACENWMDLTSSSNADDKPDKTKTKTTKVCTHDKKEDLISRLVNKRGYLEDCNILIQQWDQLHSSKKIHSVKHKSLYQNKRVVIDVGAHVGICDVDLTMSFPDVSVVAIEPLQVNLHHFKSTLMENPHLKNRIDLLPVAVGDTVKDKVALKLKDLTDWGSGQVHLYGVLASDTIQPEYVPMETVPSLLKNKKENYDSVGIIKLDAGGLECRILRSMGDSLLGVVPVIISHVHYKDLEKDGCSGKELFDILKKAGYKVFWYRGSGRLIADLPTSEKANINIVARKMN